MRDFYSRYYTELTRETRSLSNKTSLWEGFIDLYCCSKGAAEQIMINFNFYRISEISIKKV